MELRITALLLLVFTLSGADTRLLPPGNLHFYSVNTENILHWSPAQNYSQPVRYDVQYRRYGHIGEWIPVGHCTRISHHHCDLTQETWHFDTTIMARVRSVTGNRISEWENSEYFTPRDSTALGLPTFNVKADSNTFTVSISPPTLRTGVRNRSMTEVFSSSLMYVIYIRANNIDKPEEIVNSGELSTIELQPGNTYCASVKAILKADPREGNITEEKCAAISMPKPGLESSIHIICGVISAVIVLFTLCFCLGLSCQHYLKKQSAIPAVLKSLDKNKKCLSIMDYLSLIEDVVVQQVFADIAPLGLTRVQEQDDLWSDWKIKEASSMDSGVDIGNHSSDRFPASGPPLNHYMQQTPESSSLQTTSPEGGQNNSQAKESCLINMSGTVSAPSDGAESPIVSGYQKQTPKTDTAPEQEECRVEVQDTAPCFISISDIDITEGFAKGFLSLDDVMLTENGL